MKIMEHINGRRVNTVTFVSDAFATSWLFALTVNKFFGNTITLQH